MSDDINGLLVRIRADEPGALDALFSASYCELRKLARARLYRHGRDPGMNTTLLVHESYLKLVNGPALRSEHRRAFFAYASRVMRSVIVDTLRSRDAECRGGDLEAVALDTYIADSVAADEAQPLWVNEALERLSEADPRLARVVEMRYFGGYSEAEIAEALDVTERTVRRDWQKARLLLAHMLGH